MEIMTRRMLPSSIKVAACLMLTMAFCSTRSDAFVLPTLPKSSSGHHLDTRANTVSRPSATAWSRVLLLQATISPSSPAAVGPRLGINDDYPGLERVHANPDVFVIHNFLDASACQDLIEQAATKTLERSPVAYAGWTTDFQDLVELAAKGPVAWGALLGAWFQVQPSRDGTTGASQVDLVVHALQNYAALFVLATGAIAAFTYSRAQGLKELRTSTSTTLDDLTRADGGTRQFVERTAKLFDSSSKNPNHDDQNHLLRNEAALFEAPTVIRYEAGQVLAPHFDANRSAETEDANRGGQTLATLLVYLNDVEQGGLTRFGKLPALPNAAAGETKLTVQPKRGDGLLFFPADARGRFDERTEHEGCPAVDEKWIARIWRHQSRVPPPFGLTEAALQKLD